MLDAARGALLRRTLAVPFFRQLFHRRSERLVLVFLATTALMLPLAVFKPWFLLAAGPLVCGLAHLGSTVRYSGKSLGGLHQRSVTLILALALGAVGLVRLGLPLHDNSFELVGCCVVLAALGGARVLGAARMLLALVLLAPLFLASLKAPLATIQTLIIAHNFVGFFFWIREAKKRDEAAAPLFCLALFSLIHVVLFALPGENFEAAYAYGQATHYFVWLRAIPEQHLAGTAPVTYRRTFKLLRQDFGRLGTRIAVGAVLILSATWLLVSWEEARRLYFAVAAFHGYAELTMLAVLGSGYLMGMPHSSQSELKSPQSTVLLVKAKSSPT